MGLQFCDSFGYYTTAQMPRKWNSSSGYGPTVTLTGGRNSGPCCTIGQSSNRNIYQAVSGSPDTIIIGFVFKLVASVTGTDQRILQFREGSVCHAGFIILANGSIRALRGQTSGGSDGTTLGTTAASIVSTTNYVYLEFKVKVHDTTGTVDIRADGVSILSLTGQDTRNAATGIIDNVLVGTDSFSAQSNVPSCTIGDLVIVDTTGSAPNNTFLGDVRVQPLLPTTAGNYAQWTPSASTNVSNVDDPTSGADDDTTYNSSLTAAQKDSFNFADTTQAAGTVFGVAVNLVQRKDDAGVRTTRALTRLSATDKVGTAQSVQTSYLNYQTIFETDPANAAWTIANANAAEYGYELVS